MLRSSNLLFKEYLLFRCMRQFIQKNVNKDFKKQQFGLNICLKNISCAFYNTTLCSFSMISEHNDEAKSKDSSIEHRQKNNGVQPKEEIALQSWLDMYKFTGGQVPETINKKNMEILKQKFQINVHQTIKYLRFLHTKEIKQNNDAIKKKEKSKIIIEKRSKYFENIDSTDIIYRLWHNSMYGRVYRQALNNLERHRLCNALHYGQPLIIDLGFDCHKIRREISSLQNELLICINENMRHLNPYNLHLCNLHDEKRVELKEHIKVLDDPTFPMNITSKSYLDLFPKNKLIYLTPDSKNVMKKFDHNAIYIIGGIVDLRNSEPLTLAKAKREGISTMKLPLQNYLEFKHRHPLGIHVMMAIMLELQASGDFKKAFDYVPKRLLRNPDYKFGESPWDKKVILKKSELQYMNVKNYL